MDLLVAQLKSAIRRLLDTKGIRARVLDKVNRHGEVVIGVVLEKRPDFEPRPRDTRAPEPLAKGALAGAGGAGEPAGARGRGGEGT